MAVPIGIAQNDGVQQGDSALEARAVQPTPYPLAPGPVFNEWSYDNWDANDPTQQAQLTKIHEAFQQAMLMAGAAIEAIDADNNAMIQRWFNQQDDPAETRQVFANMYDLTAGRATTQASQMICDQQDFANRCTANTNAYTIGSSGRFHICPRGLNRLLNTEITCDTLDASCFLKMRSLPMTLLHEMTHYDAIGEAARNGFAPTDEASGAYDCFMLDTTKKGDNAQNYAWFAGEAYWSRFCLKTFTDPAPGIQ